MLSTTISALRRSVCKTAVLGSVSARLVHSLPDLPYDFNALEPYISAEIMQLHYTKHHQTYVNNLNIAEEQFKTATEKGDVSTAIKLTPSLRFNGGGHINHTIFWDVLSPNGGGTPEGDLKDLIIRDFGSFEDFKKELSDAAISVQGSGWSWLGYKQGNGRLKIASCANQDPLLATTGLIPLFGIDVWEHAYYLQYKNVRPSYVTAIFNVANWDSVAKRLSDARFA